MTAPGDVLAAAQRLRAARTPYVMATVVRAQRPTSARAGDRALVLADGTVEGFVGGECAESTVVGQGLAVLGSGESTLLRITPEASPAEAGSAGIVTVGNPCLSGGTLDIFLEAVIPPPLVHVYGTAPVARALASVGAALGYEVREHADPGDPIEGDTAAVVVAAHGRDEVAVLDAALAAGVPYVGLIASRRRGSAVVEALGAADADRERVRYPAGLDIGSRTPEEIALSVYAEIVTLRPRPPQTSSPGETVRAGETVGAGEEAVDPVCGMRVAVTPAALRAEHAGGIWYFCGPGCRQAFLADPAAHLPRSG